MANPVTRRRKEIKEERFGFRLKPTLDERFRAYAADNNEDMTDIIERGIEIVISGDGAGSSASEPKPNEISFELSEADAGELQKLADALYYEDPNLFAKMIMRRALDLGPDVMREFLLGQVKREVQANLEAENEASAETKASPARKARKAA